MNMSTPPEEGLPSPAVQDEMHDSEGNPLTERLCAQNARNTYQGFSLLCFSCSSSPPFLSSSPFSFLSFSFLLSFLLCTNAVTTRPLDMYNLPAVTDKQLRELAHEVRFVRPELLSSVSVSVAALYCKNCKHVCNGTSVYVSTDKGRIGCRNGEILTPGEGISPQATEKHKHCMLSVPRLVKSCHKAFFDAVYSCLSSQSHLYGVSAHLHSSKLPDMLHL